MTMFYEENNQFHLFQGETDGEERAAVIAWLRREVEDSIPMEGEIRLDREDEFFVGCLYHNQGWHIRVEFPFHLDDRADAFKLSFC